jgi:hypothetical protein
MAALLSLLVLSSCGKPDVSALRTPWGYPSG